MMNVDELGQVFTPEKIVRRMFELRRNFGTILEPSCGDGSFLKEFKRTYIPRYDRQSMMVAIEIDPEHCPENALNMDFFDYGIDNKFDTIIGNPPYVAYKNIVEDTKKKLNMSQFDNRTNLALFFMDKCLSHLLPNGEIIFITPRDFIKATSSRYLNARIYKEGTITHFYDLGDLPVFDGFSPNCAIWRFEKDCFSRETGTNDGIKKFNMINGQLIFSNIELGEPFSKYFIVKVGAVSGDDEVFEHEDGIEFVCSSTIKNGKLKKMLYNVRHPHLEKYKQRLLGRKIKAFTERDWWQWGRNFHITQTKRVYVNCKTRDRRPFFYNSCNNYDGAVLSVFFKNNEWDEQEIAEILNEVNWDDLGFKCGGRFLFSQRSLEQTILPKSISMKLEQIGAKTTKI